MRFISSIICASIAKRPAVSTITTLWPLALAWAMAAFAISTGSLLSGLLNTSIPSCSPNTFNWSIAAGRYTSQATKSGFLVFLRLR